jgi:hypothetical protein
MLLPDDDGLAEEELGNEKLNEDKTACEEVRENKLDGCLDVVVLFDDPPPDPPGIWSVTVDNRDVEEFTFEVEFTGAER